MRRKETSRIRTATNFLRRSAGPSEDALHSSVTNVADFRVLQTSHSPLKIGGKTLSLSITVKKCTVVAWQRRLQAAVDLTSRRCVFLNFFKGPWGCNAQFWYVIETFSNLHPNVEVWKFHKLVEFHKFIELDFSNSINL
jgi:hypothetical protein